MIKLNWLHTSESLKMPWQSLRQSGKKNVQNMFIYVLFVNLTTILQQVKKKLLKKITQLLTNFDLMIFFNFKYIFKFSKENIQKSSNIYVKHFLSYYQLCRVKLCETPVHVNSFFFTIDSCAGCIS